MIAKKKTTKKGSQVYKILNLGLQKEMYDSLFSIAQREHRSMVSQVLYFVEKGIKEDGK